MSEGRKKRATAEGATPATADRRRHKRFIEEVRIRYRDLEGIEPAGWGRSRDLSLGGMCLLARESVPLGAHLAMVRQLALAGACDYRRVSTAVPYLTTLGGFLVERAG